MDENIKNNFSLVDKSVEGGLKMTKIGGCPLWMIPNVLHAGMLTTEVSWSLGGMSKSIMIR